MTTLLAHSDIVYPDRDGKRMADNTKQARWITTLYGNLCALYRDDATVFVAADNLWYPVEGRPDICSAPDVYVVFGRPPHDRGSYRQWVESNVPLHVVFEILSPGNSTEEMIDKHNFYEEYGVEEYYIYNPDTNRLHAYTRQGTTLHRVRDLANFRSPRLGIRFDMSPPEMVVRGPDDRPFLTFQDTVAQLVQAQAEITSARQRASKAEDQAELAEQNAERAQQNAERAQQNAERERTLRKRLGVLSRKARLGQATPDELGELDQLEAINGAD